jgi:hypothetical protein
MFIWFYSEDERRIFLRHVLYPSARCHKHDRITITDSCKNLTTQDNVTSKSVRATIVAVEKTRIITYSEFVFVALGIQHAVRMLLVFIYDLLGSAIFFHFIL